MQLLVVHLSDLHFKASEDDNPVLSRASQLGAAVSSCAANIIGCLVVVSGDIAFSGKPAEYQTATKFFSALKQELVHRYPGVPTKLYFVPGNHDCDFSKQKGVRQALLGTITQDTFDDSVIETCAEVHDSFFAFAANWHDFEDRSSTQDLAVKNAAVDISGHSIHLYLLNTALLSNIPERQGSLQFPIAKLESSLQETAPSLAITVLHHPYNWLEATNARVFQRILESQSDLILTGHEHEYGISSVTHHKREEVEYLEGDVLQDSKSPGSSGFNVVCIELDESFQTIHHFIWHTENGLYTETSEPFTIPFIRNAARLKNQFMYSDNFEAYLNDIGANFTHSIAEQLYLDSLFVMPDLRSIYSLTEAAATGPHLINDNIVGFILENSRLLIVGADKSGKTTLAKVLNRDIRKRGLVPLMLHGSDIKHTDEKSLRNLLENVFNKQYQNTEFSAYLQIEKDNRCLIVDDYQAVPLNAKGRNKILDFLEGLFSVVILLGDDPAQFTEFMNGKGNSRQMLRYALCEIMPLGYLKRSHIIEKWISFGRLLTHDENDLQRQSLTMERIIDDVVGKGLIPSYPLFILVILQQYETHQKLDISTTSGSYGYLYEALLTTALAKASRLAPVLDTQFSYLTELAYHLHVIHMQSMQYGDCYDWHQTFCEKYGLRLDFEPLLETFSRAGILVYADSTISFKYPYIYYYFLARYFRDHIDSEEIRQQIKLMASRLHHEESANVLMFLTYLTRNPLIIETILASVAQLFKQRSQCDLVHDTQFLSNLIDAPPVLHVDGTSPNERRRSLLAKRDDTERDKHTNIEDQEEVSFEQSRVDDELDELLQLNVAFKAIQILGQILRNYPGSLTASEKLKVGTAAYSLALRALGYIFDMLSESHAEIVEVLSDLIRKHNPGWTDDDVNSRVNLVISTLGISWAFVITKHVADTAGDEGLSVTFDSLVETSPNISYRFIDVFIRLFYFPGFPEHQILTILRDVRKNPFATQLIRRIVWYYFYVTPSQHDRIEAICKKVGIEIQQSQIYDQRPKLLRAS